MSSERPVCIVTGGAAGIGAACAAAFVQSGHRVLAADVDSKAAIRVAETLGDDVIGTQCNVADSEACESVAADAISRWGRIDVLVANAGVQIGGRLIDATDEEWQTVMTVNLKGVANMCRAVLPGMIERGDGRIVIVSSNNAQRAPQGMAYYDMSKSGVLGLMRNLAVDHGREGIRANAVCPGATLTDHHLKGAAKKGIDADGIRDRMRDYGALGRVGEPEEIAAAIHFLASDAASFITGATLTVDGGFSIQA